MLRLDFKDDDETVLFFDPIMGVRINKYDDIVRSKPRYELDINTNHDMFSMFYDSMGDRDAAYEYTLNKINNYLFPQIETAEIGTPSTLESIF